MDSGKSRRCRRNAILFCVNYWAMFMLIFVISLFSCIGFATDADAGYRGPFEGRVVDQDTLEPVQGTVVHVEWESHQIWMVLAPHAVSYFYDAHEVLTDSKGHFYISKQWSWDPWTTFVMDSMVTIFKAGYGHVKTHWSTLKETSDFLQKLHSDNLKPLSPELYYEIRFEGDLPIFLLKKLTSEKEIKANSPDVSSSVPPDKKRLIMIEMGK
jgi:hypothetical protein